MSRDGLPKPAVALPNPVQESRIHVPASYFQPLNLEGLFATPQPLDVELGSGDGSFLVRVAQAWPDRNYLGVERLLGRLRKIDRKAQRAGLMNLRAIRVEAAYFLQYLLPPQSARALHVYFPDPWPKRKHRKNRLVNATFTELAARVLQAGGMVYLRTDDLDYFTQMVDVFKAAPLFQEIEIPPDLAAITTDFEREFQARGIRTLSTAYRLT